MTGIPITSADGTQLAARHTGLGTPIVLVHGSLGNIDSFVFVEPLLAERHQVWVYSWRGHVGSGDGDDYGLGRQIEDCSQSSRAPVATFTSVAGPPARSTRLERRGTRPRCDH